MATLLKKSMGPIRRQAVDLANFNPVRESLLGDDLLVDQLVEHLLSDGRFVRRHEFQLAALLDIVLGDRIAVDHDDDGLCV